MTTTSTETTTDTGAAGKTGETDTTSTDTTKVEDAAKTFSQEDLAKAVSARLAEQKRAHDRELQQLRDDAGKTDTQRIEAERDREKQRAEAATQKSAPRVAKAEAQLVAITLGGRTDRAAAIVKQADLEGVVTFDGDDWIVDDAKLAERVGKVLEEYPEWKADAAAETKETKPPAGKSGGDLGTGNAGMTLDTFKGLGLADRQKLYADDPETYRRLADADQNAAAKSR